MLKDIRALTADSSGPITMFTAADYELMRGGDDNAAELHARQAVALATQGARQRMVR
jgi:hypothetical protein